MQKLLDDIKTLEDLLFDNPDFARVFRNRILEGKIFESDKGQIVDEIFDLVWNDKITQDDLSCRFLILDGKRLSVIELLDVIIDRLKL